VAQGLSVFKWKSGKIFQKFFYLFVYLFFLSFAPLSLNRLKIKND